MSERLNKLWYIHSIEYSQPKKKRKQTNKLDLGKIVGESQENYAEW